MSKRKEDWILIYTADNKHMIASPANVRKLLNLDLSNIYKRLISAEEKIDRLEAPQRKEKIIEVLRGQGKHNRIWLFNRVRLLYQDLADLIEKGIIIESYSGSQRMIELAECARDKCE